MNTDWPAETLLFILIAFLLGGIVKGIIGTGLPTIALALLTATIGLKQGMAIILLPAILTNIRQGFLGGKLRAILKRSWSFYLATFATVWVGAAFIPQVNVTLLSGLLGIILLIYAVIGLCSAGLPEPGPCEKWLSPLVGAVNGILTGLTGSSVIPGVLYLQSLGLKKETLIQTMGLLFFISTTTLAFALKKNNLLTGELLIISAIAFIPSLLGMQIGIAIRQRISEKLFRRFFFGFMLLLGLFIISRALLRLT